ncbi:MAG: hypothetical protein KDJ52_30175 [Anaerolineae bacterium]|nr:hypothetical protein [Anaerolineae bacterium]
MNDTEREICPGCGVHLPQIDGPTHRYIVASAGCWAMFSALLNAGEPPLAPAPTNTLLIDAYAAQHPGPPSPQVIQSVAVHLITLYGVLVKGVAVDNALWIRQQALHPGKTGKKDRFEWLASPDLFDTVTVADIVKQTTPAARTEQVARYVTSVWDAWSKPHGAIIADWYEKYVGST